MATERVELRWLTKKHQTCEAFLLERLGRRLKLLSDFPVPAGALAELQLDDCLVLGEVLHCARNSGSYEILLSTARTVPLQRHRHFRPEVVPDSTFDDLQRLAQGLKLSPGSGKPHMPPLNPDTAWGKTD